MYREKRMSALFLLLSILAVGNVTAASLASGVVYEKSASFSGSVHFNDTFLVDTAGTYQATLTDFESPVALREARLKVTAGSTSQGALSGPGVFTFAADPGDYLVSLFAEARHHQASAEEKRQLLEEERNRRRDRWRSLSQDERDARKALWRKRTPEEWQAHREKVEASRERWLEKQLESMSLGQYGIEISLLNTGAPVDDFPQAGAPVPVPAAFWLFGSGALALVGFGRRSGVS